MGALWAPSTSPLVITSSLIVVSHLNRIASMVPHTLCADLTLRICMQL